MMKKLQPATDMKAVEKLVSDLKKHPKLQDYNIDEVNANMFFNMMLEQKNCENCTSIKNCKNDSFGYYTEIIEDNGIYKNKAKMCKYKIDENLVLTQNKLIKTLFIPKSFLNATLDNYQLTSQDRTKIHQNIVNFLSTFSRDNFVKGLMLSGTYGIGKTYVLSALANELSKRNIESFMIYFPDLARELKNSIGTSRFDELINTLKNIDVLILDDLGSEMMTEWLRDEIISPIINYRAGEQLPIFISTNLKLEQLVLHFSQSKVGTDKTKGTRIVKKILDLVTYCEMQDDKFQF